MSKNTESQNTEEEPKEAPQEEAKAPEENSEVTTYVAPWTIYSTGFTYNPNFPFRLAIGSFIEDTNNKVQIIQLDEEKQKYNIQATFDHNYPPTKIMWIPDEAGSRADLLATSGDILRIWANQESVSLKSQLVNNRNADYCAPLTSFDWNKEDPTMIGTASIDTTCTIWDIEKEQIRTQLIAHDKEVYDIAFSMGVNTFASVGADGSVRQFDLRNLEHSTILYESNDCSPLLRLAWNKIDANYLATIMMDSNIITVLDVRSPTVPIAELHGHQSCVNAIAWAPHSACHICTAGDDCSALIWDLQRTHQGVDGNINWEAMLSYSADAEISMLQWSPANQDWIAISFNKCIQTLRV